MHPTNCKLDLDSENNDYYYVPFCEYNLYWHRDLVCKLIAVHKPFTIDIDSELFYAKIIRVSEQNVNNFPSTPIYGT